MKLENLLNYTQPTKYIVSDEFYDDSYKTPVLTAGKTFILGYTNDEGGIYEASKSPIILFDDFTTDTKWVDFDFKVKSSACKILTLKNANSVEDLKYIYYAMMNIRFDASQHMRYWISKYSQCEIAYPEKSKRFYVVRTFDSINQLILRERQHLKLLDELIKSRFIELFPEDGNFEHDTLSSITTKITDGSHNPPKGVTFSEYIMASSQNVNDVLNLNDVRYLSKEDFDKENKRTDIQEGDVLFTIVGTIGRTYVIKSEKMVFQRSVAVIKPKKNIINSIYLKYFLSSDFATKQIDIVAHGVAQKGIYLSNLKELDIVVPKIEVQDKFASFVESVDKLKFNFFYTITKW